MKKNSPLVRTTTVRCILAIFSSHKWTIYQLDDINAFLHEELHEEIFIQMLEGMPNPIKQFCMLKKKYFVLNRPQDNGMSNLLMS